MPLPNEFIRPVSPPPPMFFGKAERNLAKALTDEIGERILGQALLYYPIDIAASNYHSVYGECIEKSFLPPVRVYGFVEYKGTETEVSEFGTERKTSLTVHLSKRRISEDQDLWVRVGDFIFYGDVYYEIASLEEPKVMFGQISEKYEITANCIRAREGIFNGA